MRPNVSIIGSGIAGMVAACYLQKQGCQVTVYEKQDSPGGRARRFGENGFVFDMGPSWYWMPEIFEDFFNDFGRTVSDYYTLKRLDPSYDIYLENDKLVIPAGIPALQQLFEQLEPGSGDQLLTYMNDAAEKYLIGMHQYASKPSMKLTEFMSWKDLRVLGRLQPFTNMRKHVERHFRHSALRKLMQFPVIFLGAMPDRIPAMYSLMNYADTALGTWYPMGGMYEIVKAMYELATGLGVNFCFNVDIENIRIEQGKAVSLRYKRQERKTDLVVGAGDYHAIEQLLPPSQRQYSDAYWDGREMAPSCLIYYLGVDRRLALGHHTLFFDSSFESHARSLYQQPDWPSDPLFYVCAPSVTDPSVAPPDCENLFVLIPIAAGLEKDGPAIRQHYFDLVMTRLEKKIGMNVRDHIIYRKDYSLNDFSQDYHAFKGNAYGLANTLRQTAIGKPRIHSSKVPNLFYCGQLTVPGPGLPPAILSGRISARAALRYLQINDHSPISNSSAYEHSLSV